MYQDIVATINAEKRDLAQSNSTLTGQLEELTAQLNAAIDTIQDMEKIWHNK